MITFGRDKRCEVRILVSAEERFAGIQRPLLKILAAVLCSGSVLLEAQQGWVVKPEWVRSHEEFLASDALGGRGSATRDEQIAAEYVASEFLAYGLKPAPGMTGMIQSADVVAPELDGKASLTFGSETLAEGTELRMLIPSGVGASGPLLRLSAADLRQASIPKGAIVLLTDLPANNTGLRIAFPLRRSGASAVLFEENDALRAYLAKSNGPQRLLRLDQEPGDASPLPATIAAVSAGGMARLLAEKPGTVATLTVHALPAKPRKTFNAVGYLAGSDAASGTILLSAHLDHLGITSAPVNGDNIFNGANDDAAGTTAVLELAHALAAGPKLRRSILFVCYGSEEAGLLGSEFFGRHPPVPLAQLVTDIEFEMIGAQDPKMPKGALLLTGWERSNLGPALREHGAMVGPDPYPEQHFFERSDNYSLALEGVIAHTAAGWGTVPTYHQLNDDLAHIDFAFMTAAIQSFVEPIRWLAGSGFKPAWNPGGQPRR